MLLTVTVAMGILASSILGTVDPGDCGGGWGQWSVPINTLLLIVLFLVQSRNRRKLDEVKAVTDTVKLRDRSKRVDLD